MSAIFGKIKQYFSYDGQVPNSATNQGYHEDRNCENITEADHNNDSPMDAMMNQSSSPLLENYKCLKVRDLLQLNNQSLKQLVALRSGIGIIIRYARHLTKPPDQRSNQWFIIPENNKYVQDKIKPIKGHEHILHDLGFTQITEEGMKFPEGTEPNIAVVRSMEEDMLLFRKELKSYLEGKHPSPDKIDQFLPVETLIEIDQSRATQSGYDDEIHLETMTTLPPISSLELRKNPEVGSPLRCTRRNEAQGPPTSTQIPSDRTGSSSGDSKYMSVDSERNNPSPHQTEATQLAKTFGAPGGATGGQEESLVAPGELNFLSQVPEDHTEIVSTNTGSGHIASGSQLSSGRRAPCDVCGEEADLLCLECYKKPLCQLCNLSWHKHPSRKGHNSVKVGCPLDESIDSQPGFLQEGAYGISAQDGSKSRKRASFDTRVLNVQSNLSGLRPASFGGGSMYAGGNTMYAGGNNLTPSPESAYHLQRPSYFMGGYQQQPVQPQHFSNFDPSQQQRLLTPGGGVGQNQQLHYGMMQQSLSANDLNRFQAGAFSDGNFHTAGAMPGPVASAMHASAPKSFQAEFEEVRHGMLMPSASGLSHQGRNEGIQQLSYPSPRMQPRTPLIMPLNPQPQQRLMYPTMQPRPTQIYTQPQNQQFHSLHPSQDDPHPTTHSNTQQLVKPVWYTDNQAYNNQQFQAQSSPEMKLTSFAMSTAPVFSQGLQTQARPSLRYVSIPISNNPTMAFNRLPPQSPLYAQGNYVQNFRSPHLGNNPVGNNSIVRNVINNPLMSLSSQPAQGIQLSHFPQVRLQSPLDCAPNREHEQFNTFSDNSLLRSSSLTSKPVDSIILMTLKSLQEEKQAEACANYLDKFKGDIQELQEQIDLRLVDDYFEETTEFRDMNKRKAVMLKEKRALEDFQKQLRNKYSNKTQKSDMRHQKFGVPKYREEFDVGLPALLDNESDITPVMDEIELPNQRGEEAREVSDFHNHMCPDDSVQMRAGGDFLLQNRMDSQSDKTMPEKKPINVERMSPLSSEQPQNFVRREPKVPTESSVQMEKGIELPPRPQSKHVETAHWINTVVPPPKLPLGNESKKPSWQCQHCTFINDADSHACNICDKTSDRPVLIVENSTTELADGPFGPDPFIHQLNQLQASSQSLESEEPSNPGVKQLGQHINCCQDKVFIEKTRAQKKFEDKELTDHQLAVQMQLRESQLPSNTEEENDSLTTASEAFLAPTKSVANVKKSEVLRHPQLSKVCEQIGSGDYPSSPSTESEAEALEALAELDNLGMAETLKNEGEELVLWAKMADKNGFSIDALSIAMSFCKSPSSPVEWLRKNWEKNLKKIVDTVKQIGADEEKNDVGELSREEAEESFISCHGNVNEAVNKCVSSRKELFKHLDMAGKFPREEILHAMLQFKGDRETAESKLVDMLLLPFAQRIWAEKENARPKLQSYPGQEMCNSICSSVITQEGFQELIRCKELDEERRIRMILIEGKLKSWGRAQMVIDLLDSEFQEEDVVLEDIVEAVRDCKDRRSALAYLKQECALCFSYFPMTKIRNLNFCQCKMCEHCLAQNFTVAIREKSVRHWTCPLCELPDLDNIDDAHVHFHFLSMLLQPMLNQELKNLYEIKVRDLHLQQSPNFRWCGHCEYGFLVEDAARLKMTCPKCKYQTCFRCDKKWEDQHEGLSCDEFETWKKNNDPKNQAAGLRMHLDAYGIDCPHCKTRFDLAKGGCMHFTCSQCSYEFCSGCNQPFQKVDCKRFASCAGKGLHCHHPRDCLFYLRDFSVEQLQKVLKLNKTVFNTAIPADQSDPNHCPVMEQKENDAGKNDEACGKDTAEGQAGLCELHYKEYLTGLMNKKALDPVIIMNVEELQTVLKRHEMVVPNQQPKEPPKVYTASLMEIIKGKLPLKPR